MRAGHPGEVFGKLLRSVNGVEPDVINQEFVVLSRKHLPFALFSHDVSMWQVQGGLSGSAVD
jgi:hypothetical protein